MIREFVPYVRHNGPLYILLMYVILCVTIGGASRYWLDAHAILQLLAALGLFALILTWPKNISLTGVRLPILALVLIIGLGVMQTIPFSKDIWALLPGRDRLFADLQLLGAEPAQLTASLDPEATLSNLGYPLIPLFVILLFKRVGEIRMFKVLPVFLALLGASNAAFGLMQVYSDDDSFLYLYDHTNVGFPVGFFANVNHSGTLMLLCLPITIGLWQQAFHSTGKHRQLVARAVGYFSIVLLMLVGIAASGSLAIYVLLIPCLILTLLVINSGIRFSRILVSTLVMLFTTLPIAILIVSSSPILSNLGALGSSHGPTSRTSIWSYTVRGIEEHWPIGTGMGTYQSVIPQYEDPDLVSSTFIALAHNDYLQFVMELGAPGLVIIIVGLIWLLTRLTIIWRNGRESEQAKFYQLVLIGVSVCAIQSILDYPARTPAIAAILALFVGVLTHSNNSSKTHEKKATSIKSKVL